MQLKQLFFLYGLLLSLSCLAQGSWTKKADFAGGDRMRAVGFSINGKGYIGLGLGKDSSGATGYKKDFWEYNPITDNWSRMADFPGDARQAATGFSIDDKGYVGTGICDSVTKDFWAFDPQLNQWTQIADFGGAPRQGACGFSIDGKGYVVAGNNTLGNYFRDLWEYTPANNQWVQKGNMPGVNRKNPVAFVINSIAYIGGGDYTSVFDDFWLYDSDINSWSAIADFGGGPVFNSVGFSLGDMGFAGTGSRDASQKLDTFLRFNPTTNSWMPQTSFSDGNRTLACGFSIGEKGYIGTGYADNDIWKTDFWEFTPAQTTSIDQSVIKRAGVQIYPNPAKESVTIKFESEIELAPVFDVFTNMGQKIEVPGKYKKDKIVIETQALTTGMYFFKIQTSSDKIFNGKFFIE